MFQVCIDTAKGMHVGNFYITDPICLIGKKPGNGVVLHGWRIDPEHARLQMDEDGVHVHDLNSKSGTRVNGAAISSYGPLRAEDVIEIHDYRLKVLNRNPQPGTAPNDRTAPAPNLDDASVFSASTNTPPHNAAEQAPATQPSDDALTQSAALPEQALELHRWRVRVRKTLHEQMDLRRINVSSMSEDELRKLATRLTAKAIADQRELPGGIDRDVLAQQVVSEAVGLGPLEPLLARDDISEIMVNSCQEVFFERGGRMYKSDVTFTDDQAIQSTIERIVAPTGRRIDESSPMVDARLKDGSRINAVIPPLALKGSCLTIRKFMNKRLTADHLIEFGSADRAIVDFLQVAVRYKRNILVSGGTGSGKTTLLNMLSNFIPDGERIVTIEDSAELRLHQPNLVSLEARPSNQEGRGAVTIRDLVRNSLRMRPDRIVVGECRGGEALDMLQAMNTGHDGSLTTAHANSARDCISRVEVMVMMAGMDLPAAAIREQIASAVHLIVQQTRFACGSRKITGISEVVGVENGRIQLAEVFRFQATGYDAAGRVAGHYVPTGLVPEFYESLKNRGVGLDLSLFEPKAQAR